MARQVDGGGLLTANSQHNDGVKLTKRPSPQCLANPLRGVIDAFQLQASALAYLALGREQEAAQTIEALIDNFHKVMAYQIAGIFAFQGKPDEALNNWGQSKYLRV